MNKTTFCGSSRAPIRNPQGASTLVPAYHNKVTELLDQGIAGPTTPSASTRVLPVPASAIRARRHRMLAPKPWQSFTGRVADAETTEAIGFHPLDLSDSEQGVGHESVSVKDGVVHARHAGHSTPLADLGIATAGLAAWVLTAALRVYRAVGGTR